MSSITIGPSVTMTALSFGDLLGWSLSVRGRVVLELGPLISYLTSSLDPTDLSCVSAGRAKKLVLEIINELSTRIYQRNLLRSRLTLSLRTGCSTGLRSKVGVRVRGRRQYSTPGRAAPEKFFGDHARESGLPSDLTVSVEVQPEPQVLEPDLLRPPLRDRVARVLVRLEVYGHRQDARRGRGGREFNKSGRGWWTRPDQL